MRKLIPAWLRVPIGFFIIYGIIEYFVDSGNEPAFMKYPVIMLFLVLVLFILIGIEAIVAALEKVMYSKLDPAAQERYRAERATTKQYTWLKDLYKKLVGARPIEKESEIVLDHDYDGIKELDNSLPPWWLYSFYLTIIFAVVYMLRYHVFDGPTQYDELETDLAEAEIAYEEYLKTAKDLVDFNTVELLTDASDLSAGKVIFDQNCVACHLADGRGSIGPNLTDEYWILGGGIKNVFKTVSEGGRDGKGMIAWKELLKPSEIAQVSSYLLTLQENPPADGKAPEGEIWVDESTTEEP